MEPDKLEEKSTLRFNDTSDYQHMSLMGVGGVFTDKNVDPSSLPEGFHAYFLAHGKGSQLTYVLTAEAKPEDLNVAGIFVCEKALPKTGEIDSESESPKLYPGQDFNFLKYFGVNLSIDCQIKDAYQRREALLSADAARTQGKDYTKTTSKGDEGRE